MWYNTEQVMGHIKKEKKTWNHNRYADVQKVLCFKACLMITDSLLNKNDRLTVTAKVLPVATHVSLQTAQQILVPDCQTSALDCDI